MIDLRVLAVCMIGIPFFVTSSSVTSSSQRQKRRIAIPRHGHDPADKIDMALEVDFIAESSKSKLKLSKRESKFKSHSNASTNASTNANSKMKEHVSLSSLSTNESEDTGDTGNVANSASTSALRKGSTEIYRNTATQRNTQEEEKEEKVNDHRTLRLSFAIVLMIIAAVSLSGWVYIFYLRWKYARIHKKQLQQQSQQQSQAHQQYMNEKIQNKTWWNKFNQNQYSHSHDEDDFDVVDFGNVDDNNMENDAEGQFQAVPAPARQKSRTGRKNIFPISFKEQQHDSEQPRTLHRDRQSKLASSNRIYNSERGGNGNSVNISKKKLSPSHDIIPNQKHHGPVDIENDDDDDDDDDDTPDSFARQLETAAQIDYHTWIKESRKRQPQNQYRSPRASTRMSTPRTASSSSFAPSSRSLHRISPSTKDVASIASYTLSPTHNEDENNNGAFNNFMGKVADHFPTTFNNFFFGGTDEHDDTNDNDTQQQQRNYHQTRQFPIPFDEHSQNNHHLNHNAGNDQYNDPDNLVLTSASSSTTSSYAGKNSSVEESSSCAGGGRANDPYTISKTKQQQQQHQQFLQKQQYEDNGGFHVINEVDEMHTYLLNQHDDMEDDNDTYNHDGDDNSSFGNNSGMEMSLGTHRSASTISTALKASIKQGIGFHSIHDEHPDVMFDYIPREEYHAAVQAAALVLDHNNNNGMNHYQQKHQQRYSNGQQQQYDKQGNGNPITPKITNTSKKSFNNGNENHTTMTMNQSAPSDEFDEFIASKRMASHQRQFQQHPDENMDDNTTLDGTAADGGNTRVTNNSSSTNSNSMDSELLLAATGTTDKKLFKELKNVSIFLKRYESKKSLKKEKLEKRKRSRSRSKSITRSISKSLYRSSRPTQHKILHNDDSNESHFNNSIGTGNIVGKNQNDNNGLPLMYTTSTGDSSVNHDDSMDFSTDTSTLDSRAFRGRNRNKKPNSLRISTRKKKNSKKRSDNNGDDEIEVDDKGIDFEEGGYQKNNIAMSPLETKLYSNKTRKQIRREKRAEQQKNNTVGLNTRQDHRHQSHNVDSSPHHSIMKNLPNHDQIPSDEDKSTQNNLDGRPNPSDEEERSTINNLNKITNPSDEDLNQRPSLTPSPSSSKKSIPTRSSIQSKIRHRMDTSRKVKSASILNSTRPSEDIIPSTTTATSSQTQKHIPNLAISASLDSTMSDANFLQSEIQSFFSEKNTSRISAKSIPLDEDPVIIDNNTSGPPSRSSLSSSNHNLPPKPQKRGPKVFFRDDIDLEISEIRNDHGHDDNTKDSLQQQEQQQHEPHQHHDQSTLTSDATEFPSFHTSMETTEIQVGALSRLGAAPYNPEESMIEVAKLKKEQSNHQNNVPKDQKREHVGLKNPKEQQQIMSSMDVKKGQDSNFMTNGAHNFRSMVAGLETKLENGAVSLVSMFNANRTEKERPEMSSSVRNPNSNRTKESPKMSSSVRKPTSMTKTATGSNDKNSNLMKNNGKSRPDAITKSSPLYDNSRSTKKSSLSVDTMISPSAINNRFSGRKVNELKAKNNNNSQGGKSSAETLNFNKATATSMKTPLKSSSPPSTGRVSPLNASARSLISMFESKKSNSAPITPQNEYWQYTGKLRQS